MVVNKKLEASPRDGERRGLLVDLLGTRVWWAPIREFYVPYGTSDLGKQSEESQSTPKLLVQLALCEIAATLLAAFPRGRPYPPIHP